MDHQSNSCYVAALFFFFFFFLFSFLQTSMDFNVSQACFAMDRTTPMEFAHAAFCSSFAMTSVAAITAQQVATVDRF